MTKFLVHRTFAAYVTELTAVEADDADAAQEAVMNGEGDYVGMSVGDSVSFLDNESIETFPCHPNNVPTCFCRPMTDDEMRKLPEFSS